jgi:hypothetical protein
LKITGFSGFLFSDKTIIDMKLSWIPISFILFSTSLVFAQNVGINTQDPQGDLHVVSPLMFEGPSFLGWGNDDVHVNYENYSGNEIRTYIIQVTDDFSDPNLFIWSDDGGWNWSTDEAMSTSPVALSHGILVYWEATNGHFYNDMWQWTVGKDLDGLLIKDGIVGVGTNEPDPSAQLDIVSNRGGILIPRLSMSERYSIESPATGLLVYQTDDNKFYYYDGLNWIVIGSGADPVFSRVGSVVRQLGHQDTDDFVFGNNTLTGTGENMFFFDKSKGAFRAGVISNNNWQPTNVGEGSFASGTNSKASGKNSIAVGSNATASGNASAAIGSTIASGGNAIALGDATRAAGDASFAVGFESFADGFVGMSIGAYNEANGMFSTAIGLTNIASADYSMALGNGCRSIGDYSIVAANQSRAFSAYETVMGRLSSEYSPLSATSWNAADRLFVIGNGTSTINRHNALTLFKSGDLIINGDEVPVNGIDLTSQFMYYNSNKSAFRGGELDVSDDWSPINTGYASFAYGYNTRAKGFASTAFGSNTQALGSQSFAMGINNLASGNAALAWGSNTEAIGGKSTAWGTDTYAGADWSTAFGYINEANGEGSTAWGSYNFADGDYATVFGYKNNAESFGETVLGHYNSPYTALGADSWNPADRLLVVGNGADASNRHNAFTLYKNGTLLINSDELPANGVDVTAAFLAFDADKHAFRGGRLLSSDAWSDENRGEGSFGYGRNNMAMGDFSTAFGINTKAESYLETVIGRFNTSYTPVGTSTWNESDRLFVVGNGVSSFTENNALTLLKNGDLIINGDDIPENGAFLTRNFFFFNKDKYAFRGGRLSSSDDWSPENTGDASIAFGHDTQAKGNYSSAWGDRTIASGENSAVWGTLTNAEGDHATAWGLDTDAYGKYATAWGLTTKAESYLETVLGRYNTNYTPIGVETWDTADRLFVIGNGPSALNTHNALTVMKDGKTGIGTDVPGQILEVEGKIKIGDDSNTPEAGTIRWNAETEDFEGYDGEKWRSLTKSKESWGNILANENTKITTIDGENHDWLGFSVAISGDFAIAGAKSKDIGGVLGVGAVYIFQYDGIRWNQQTIMTASDGEENDAFGYAVAIEGHTAVVGVPWDDVGTNTGQGSVYIFEYDGLYWTEQDHLFASDGEEGDWFGVSVALSGNHLVIGAMKDQVNTEDEQGSGYIFYNNGSTWTQQAKLTALDGDEGDQFGVSVCISGEKVIIGALLDDVGTNTEQGSAYVFKYNGSTWNQQAKLSASEGDVEDWFGWSVAIFSDHALIGSPKNDMGSGFDQGSVYVFYYNGSSWTQQGQLVASDQGNGDTFGRNVSINGDYAIIGAPNWDGNANGQGAVYIFRFDGGSWIQQSRLIASDGSAGENFGEAVSISENHVIVGLYQDNIGLNENQGSVYFFSK